MKTEAGLAAECLLAVQGHTLTDDDDDHGEGELARAFVGALMQAEALAEIRALRRDIVEFLKALSR